MPNNLNFVFQNLAMSLPMLLASAVGLLMVSIFRQRATGAASTAMWCLIVMLINTIVGALLFAVIPMIAGNFGGENFRLISMALSFLQRLINSGALVGLVYAVFQDRLSESDKLPELDEWPDQR